MIETTPIPSDGIVEYSQLAGSQLPLATPWIGGLLVIIFSFSFLRIIQLKVQGWNRDKTSPLPLEGFYSITSWLGVLSGFTIMFTGVLQVFSFSPVNSLIASLLLAFITGIPMWGVVKQLLVDVESGMIKEIDQYFY